MMNSIRQAVTDTILRVVDNDGDFIWIVGVGAQRAHGLLNVESERFGRTRKDNGLTIGHVEALAEKISVAKDAELALTKLVDDKGAQFGRSFSVAMRGGNAGGVESFCDVHRMIDVDAIANGFLAVGVEPIIGNDVAGDRAFVHAKFQFAIVEVTMN